VRASVEFILVHACRSFIIMRLLIGPLALLALAAVAGCQSAPKTAQAPGPANTAAAGALPDQKNVAVMWIHGMACPQCSYNVDLQLKKVPGVEKVQVDMLTGMVKAYLSPTDPPTREQLTKAVSDTTFTLVRLDMPGERQQ
jgi:copper chaperone CopZ